jgi:hypothetical protein
VFFATKMGFFDNYYLNLLQSLYKIGQITIENVQITIKIP